MTKTVELPGKEKLAEKVEEWGAIPHTMTHPPVPSRPFLDSIRKDRLDKQAQIEDLERQITKLWELERFVEVHSTADSLLTYFAQQSQQINKL